MSAREDWPQLAPTKDAAKAKEQSRTKNDVRVMAGQDNARGRVSEEIVEGFVEGCGRRVREFVLENAARRGHR
jgi:hypothetical protein